MHLNNFLKNILLKVELYFNALIGGTKAAGDLLTSSNSEDAGGHTLNEQHVSEDSVYKDLLKGEITEEVIETRDKNYRVYKESDKYRYLGNGNVEKKTYSLQEKHCDVYSDDELKVLIIQDNHEIVKGVTESLIDIDDSSFDTKSNYLLKIKRSSEPRFLIEKYAKRIVVKKNEDKYVIELYFSKYPRAYIPSDSLFINEVIKISEGYYRNPDTLDFDELYFVTDKAFGADDITKFSFKNVTYIGTVIYDGNFVIRFNAESEIFGEDLTKKYKTKELDEKYKNKERKNNSTINLETAISFVNSNKNDEYLDDAISLKNELLKLK